MSTHDPLWYKDAVIYELHVRAFYDSDADGIGDFGGLYERLDYLEDLGVTALWLLPFYPSPLRDDGYDIGDYTNINPMYGTLELFKQFLDAAHARNMQVITELVINHTSDQHPWFQRARHAPPGSPERDFYVWSDTPERYRDARIIFQDFEHSNWSWDPVARAYYWHRFYHHQPDLNFDNPAVQRAVFDVLDFWLGLGVDGLRLDAVPYLFERDGTNCENLAETHVFLKKLRRYVDERYPNRMLLAEANQWPEDAARYFGDGDECHMNFHFPIMPRLFMSLSMEDRYPIIDILEQTPEVPNNCQWAMFLRNHDELTLEMVTEEERDYMWRVYAHEQRMRINLGIRRRLAPLLQNDRRKIELMNALLFSLPGSPVIYYGDEIGMGDNVYLGDRNGVRTPVQWSPDRNAGFSRANPQSLYLPVVTDPEYHYEAVNIENARKNSQSLLWWMKRIIGLRKSSKAFSRGTLRFLSPDNRHVLVFVREFAGECILVIANLSRFAQHVALDLSAFEGQKLVEMLGRVEFPRVADSPYALTLGPYSFYWFSVEPTAAAVDAAQAAPDTRPRLAVDHAWATLLEPHRRHEIERLLPSYLRRCRWFGGKGRSLSRVQLDRLVPLSLPDGEHAALLMISAIYSEGDPDLLLLPITCLDQDDAEPLLSKRPAAALANVAIHGEASDPDEAVLVDAAFVPAFGERLLKAFAQSEKISLPGGTIVFQPGGGFDGATNAETDEPLTPNVLTAEQSNTSVAFGERYILKLFRRVLEGVNPEIELSRALTERAGFTHTPSFCGVIELRQRGATPMALGVLQEYVHNEGDAWRFTLEELRSYFERAQTLPADTFAECPTESVLACALREGVPPAPRSLIGHYIEAANLLGRRTGEMHVALASLRDDPDFAPEGFGPLYQRSLYQSLRNLTGQTFQQARGQLAGLPRERRALAEQVLSRHTDVLGRFHQILDYKLAGWRTRVHGDYHLGQVLYTGADFMIIDFEGEPARPLADRRRKRSPLRDVAGMLRSFSYAAESALRQEMQADTLALAAELWVYWASVSFLHGYFEASAEAELLPRDPNELQLLLDIFLLEKAIYELGYEINNRPDWVDIPLRGIRRLIERPY